MTDFLDGVKGVNHFLFGGGDAPNAGGAGAPDDLLQVHPDTLLSFAGELESRAADLERGLAAERQKVEDAVRRSGSMYTKDSRVSPVFKPMGSAVGKALDKAEANVTALTATLRNDAELLRGLVQAHEEAERRAVHGWESGELQMKPR
ncbi:hypothetical protein E3G52_001022 [Mycobacteroides abscessus]|uniref:hypothetical protein n=1 Tax=Mycobacteroides abscessus TaxID=36809 RepID=UPI001C6B43F0|nr:hypothetical protein [Mycobacteroides abscessus]MBE5454149.1 hypothetical protein [Mycobacteroides abscessus]